MKKIILIHFVLLTVISQAFAQKEDIFPFFDASGNVALQTQEMKSLADTIATINHRRDDIVWSRIVYRVIDMRDKANNQLYYPIVPNSRYKSLLRLILEIAAKDSIKAYEKKDEDIQPAWEKEPIPSSKLGEYFVDCDWDSVEVKVKKTPLFVKDKLTNKLTVNDYGYSAYATRQVKFLVQEIVFFNKHYSRMYTKTIAIAPIYTYSEMNVTKLNTGGITKTPENIWNYFQSSVVCWFLYDKLRPFLVRQLLIPNGNESQRFTYDDFFTQRLYNSYILGDSNMFDKVLLRTYSDPTSLRREQKRIEDEIMDIEQDVWEQ